MMRALAWVWDWGVLWFALLFFAHAGYHGHVIPAWSGAFLIAGFMAAVAREKRTARRVAELKVMKHRHLAEIRCLEEALVIARGRGPHR